MEIKETIRILRNYFDNNRRTTLNRMRIKKDPYKILIGCLVSINIKDEVTEKILEELFSRANSFKEILEIDDTELERILYLARYRKVKANALKSVSREILERFDGIVPENREDLLSIKNIGPKTASLVLSFAYNKKALPVDSNTTRIVNRMGITNKKKAEEIEKILLEKLDDELIKDANAIFMLHGKNICVPVKPFCSKCPIEKYCMKIGVEKSR